MVVAGARDHVELLLAREVDELHRIARDADREVRVFGLFRMLHRIDQLVGAEDIDVQMVRALGEVIVRAGNHDYIATLPQAALAVLIAALLVWLLWSLIGAAIALAAFFLFRSKR